MRVPICWQHGEVTISATDIAFSDFDFPDAFTPIHDGLRAVWPAAKVAPTGEGLGIPRHWKNQRATGGSNSVAGTAPPEALIVPLTAFVDRDEMTAFGEDVGRLSHQAVVP